MFRKLEQHRYPYIIAASCFLMQAVGVGTYFSFGVFFNPLVSEFGWSRSAISGASSTAFLLMGLLGIYAGRLNDRIGPKLIVTVTSLMFGLGLLLMSRLQTIWELYFYFGLIIGIGLSSIDVIALSTVARWFSRNRGTMTGIVKIGTGVGQLTVPLAAGLLIANFGWRNAFIVIGISVGLILFLIAQLLRRDPENSGQAIQPNAKRSLKRLGLPAVAHSVRASVRSLPFVTICLINFAAAFCFMTIVVHVVPHVQDLGISSTKAAGVLSVIGGVSMAGRLGIGIAIDRIGSKWSMNIATFLLTTALSWLYAADTLWRFYLFAAIYGLAHGSFFTAMSPIVAELFGIRIHGALFGIVAFCATFGGAVGPILAGYIFDHSGSYDLVICVCIFVSAFSLLLGLSLTSNNKDESKNDNIPA